MKKKKKNPLLNNPALSKMTNAAGGLEGLMESLDAVKPAIDADLEQDEANYYAAVERAANSDPSPSKKITRSLDRITVEMDTSVATARDSVERAHEYTKQRQVLKHLAKTQKEDDLQMEFLLLSKRIEVLEKELEVKGWKEHSKEVIKLVEEQRKQQAMLEKQEEERERKRRQRQKRPKTKSARKAAMRLAQQRELEARRMEEEEEEVQVDKDAHLDNVRLENILTLPDDIKYKMLARHVARMERILNDLINLCFRKLAYDDCKHLMLRLLDLKIKYQEYTLNHVEILRDIRQNIHVRLLFLSAPENMDEALQEMKDIITKQFDILASSDAHAFKEHLFIDESLDIYRALCYYKSTFGSKDSHLERIPMTDTEMVTVHNLVGMTPNERTRKFYGGSLQDILALSTPRDKFFKAAIILQEKDSKVQSMLANLAGGYNALPQPLRERSDQLKHLRVLIHSRLGYLHTFYAPFSNCADETSSFMGVNFYRKALELHQKYFIEGVRHQMKGPKARRTLELMEADLMVKLAYSLFHAASTSNDDSLVQQEEQFYSEAITLCQTAVVFFNKHLTKSKDIQKYPTYGIELANALQLLSHMFFQKSGIEWNQLSDSMSSEERHQVEKAVKIIDPAIEIYDQLLGKESYLYASSIYNKAILLNHLRRHDEAEAIFNKMESLIQRPLPGEDEYSHHSIFQSFPLNEFDDLRLWNDASSPYVFYLERLAVHKLLVGKSAESIALFRKVIDMLNVRFPNTHCQLREETAQHLGMLYMTQTFQLDLAVETLKESLERMERFGAVHSLSPESTIDLTERKISNKFLEPIAINTRTMLADAEKELEIMDGISKPEDELVVINFDETDPMLSDLRLDDWVEAGNLEQKRQFAKYIERLSPEDARVIKDCLNLDEEKNLAELSAKKQALMRKLEQQDHLSNEERIALHQEIEAHIEDLKTRRFVDVMVDLYSLDRHERLRLLIHSDAVAAQQNMDRIFRYLLQKNVSLRERLSAELPKSSFNEAKLE